MEETHKLTLKRVEPSLSKFNEVIVPHHLDLLRQHKANIVKYTKSGDLSRARSEQDAAARACSRLRAHIIDLDALCAQLSPADARAFKAATASARDSTVAAVREYFGVIATCCRELATLTSETRSIPSRTSQPIIAGSVTSSDSVGVLPEPDESGVEYEPAPLGHVRLQLDDGQSRLREKEVALEGWTELHREVSSLHEAWGILYDTARDQKEVVGQTAANIEVAASNVEEARKTLSKAERLKGGLIIAGGCVAGLAAGGPVGFLLGLKAGAAAAAGAALITMAGARVIKSREEKQD